MTLPSLGVVLSLSACVSRHVTKGRAFLAGFWKVINAPVSQDLMAAT
jgi:hypothetical protein